MPRACRVRPPSPARARLRLFRSFLPALSDSAVPFRRLPPPRPPSRPQTRPPAPTSARPSRRPFPRPGWKPSSFLIPISLLFATGRPSSPALMQRACPIFPTAASLRCPRHHGCARSLALRVAPIEPAYKVYPHQSIMHLHPVSARTSKLHGMGRPERNTRLLIVYGTLAPRHQAPPTNHKALAILAPAHEAIGHSERRSRSNGGIFPRARPHVCFVMRASHSMASTSGMPLFDSTSAGSSQKSANNALDVDFDRIPALTFRLL